LTLAVRIAQIMLGKRFGGAERSFVDLCRALVARDHEVLAVCEGRADVRRHLEQMEGIAYRTLKVYGPWDFLARRTIERYLRDFGADIAQLHLARAAGLGGAAARAIGIPTVAKTHNYVDLKYYRAIDYLVPTTLKQHRFLVAGGIPEPRLSLIPNFSPIVARREAGAGGAVGDRPLNIVAIGRLVHKKGFDILLHALAAARRHGVVFRCAIAGAGPERQALLKLCGELALENAVSFLGWQHDVRDCLTGADVFILPSRYEPFGIVCLEAMALGIPIVATRTDGPSEILDADTATLVPIDEPEDLARALGDIAADPTGAQRRAQAARARFARDYSEEAVVTRYLALYAEMAANRGDSKHT
jgi:glycosyltransferase involved in cell wall biosynthesis